MVRNKLLQILQDFIIGQPLCKNQSFNLMHQKSHCMVMSNILLSLSRSRTR